MSATLVVDENRLASLTETIQSELAELDTQVQATVAVAIRVGEALDEAKLYVTSEQGYGHWGSWLDDNFQLTERTASTYMRLARNQDAIKDQRTITAAAAALSRGASEVPSEDRKPGRDPLRWHHYRQMVEDKAEVEMWDKIVARRGKAKTEKLISQLETERAAMSATLKSLKRAVEHLPTD